MNGRLPIKVISYCMFCHRLMLFQRDRYCGQCYRDALALAAELDAESGDST